MNSFPCSAETHIYCLNDLYQRAMSGQKKILWRDAVHEAGKFLDANLYMDQLAMTDDHGWCWLKDFFPEPAAIPDHLGFCTIADFDGGIEDWQIARIDVAFYHDHPFGVLISCGRDLYCDFLNRFISDGVTFMRALADLRKVAVKSGLSVRLDWRKSIIAPDQPLPTLSRFYGYELTPSGIRRSPLPLDGDLPFAWLTQTNTMIEHLHTFWYDQPDLPGTNAPHGKRSLTNPVYRAAMLQTLFEGMMTAPEPFSRVAILDYQTDHEWWPLLVAHEGGVFAFATEKDLMNGEIEDPSWRMKWRNATILRQLSPDSSAFDSILADYRF